MVTLAPGAPGSPNAPNAPTAAESPDASGSSLSADDRRALLRYMMLSREVERRCCELNPRWFPAEGEEAAIVGAFYGLREEDVIAAHYRGPFIAYYMRGADLARLVGQALARENGYARGRALGFTGPVQQNALPWVAGDLGTSLGVATGAALGLQYEESDRVVVCTFGDGTSNRGDFHEALNLASVWKLPVVYVCQHNQYSISLHASQVLGGGSVAARASGYGMPGEAVDGNDVFAVQDAVARAVRRARAGEGPSLIEALTYRLGGHWASDPEGYRATGELEQWRLRDPLPRLEAALVERGDLDRAGIERLWSEVRDEAQRAVDAAQAAPAPGPQDLGLDEVLAR
jgi:TPP-dependent pyruvate/acetoin dehydrogenase alpha subunit